MSTKRTAVKDDDAISGRAATQATRTRKIRQRLKEELRDKFKGAEYIRQLEMLADDLIKMQKSVAVAKKKRLTAADKIVRAEITQTLDIYELEIRIIKERISLNFRRLKFILPELRSMELTDPDGKNPLKTLGSALSQLTKALEK